MQLLAFFLASLLRSSAATDDDEQGTWQPLGPWGKMKTHMIVGGTAARVGEFPEMASLERGGRHFCGGALITPTHVLTAAHCTNVYPASRIKVRVGTNKRGSGGVVISAARIRRHPDYIPRKADNDISIIELAEPFEFGATIQAGTLADEGREPEDLEKLVIIGWGSKYEGVNLLPKDLQKATVPYVPNDRCAKLYSHLSHLVNVTDTMLCAGNEASGGVDSCQGDSGGPIFFESDRAQVGITSWGSGCARPRSPGVYTRIPKYRDWISSITGVRTN